MSQAYSQANAAWICTWATSYKKQCNAHRISQNLRNGRRCQFRFIPHT